MRTPLLHALVAALCISGCGTPSPAPPSPEPAMDTPDATSTPRDEARARFQAAVASAFGVDPASVTVQPVHAGLPDNPYDALQTGALYALRADFPGADPGPAGFASPDGQVAFARHPRGLAALMMAVGLTDEAPPSMPLDAIVERVTWAHPSFGKATNFDPVRGTPLPAASLEPSPEGRGAKRLTWHAVRAGATGSQEVHRLVLHIADDGGTRLEAQKL